MCVVTAAQRRTAPAQSPLKSATSSASKKKERGLRDASNLKQYVDVCSHAAVADIPQLSSGSSTPGPKFDQPEDRSNMRAQRSGLKDLSLISGSAFGQEADLGSSDPIRLIGIRTVAISEHCARCCSAFVAEPSHGPPGCSPAFCCAASRGADLGRSKQQKSRMFTKRAVSGPSC